MFDVVDRFATHAGRVVMKICGAAVILMMVAIVVQVVASRLGVTTVLDMPGDWPLFGRAITLNSLTDLQWYLLSAIALLPAGIVWLRGVHVRVDFAYSQFGPRGKAVVDLTGLVVFALPFLVMVLPEAWSATVTSFSRGEASPNGGLGDRFLPRGTMPIGLGLLLAALLFEAWLLIRAWGRQYD